MTSPRNRSTLVVVVFASLVTAVCNPLNDPLPTEVRIVVGGDGPGPFVLVVSNQFLGTGPGRDALTFGSADTTLVSVGFDEVFPLGPRDRVYVGLGRSEGGAPPLSVTLQVFLEGETICARAVQALGDGQLECLYVG